MLLNKQVPMSSKPGFCLAVAAYGYLQGWAKVYFFFCAFILFMRWKLLGILQ